MKSRILYDKRDFDGVVTEIGKVLKVEENHLEALLLRGRGYFYLGDHDLAIR